MSYQNHQQGKFLEEFKLCCQKQDHNNERIVLACLDKKCRENLLCCCICVDEEHQKHEIISLRKFEKNMNQKLQQNNKNLQKGKILKLFQDYRTNFINKLKIIENALLSKINSLEDMINTVFSEVRTSLIIPAHNQLIQHLLQTSNSQEWSKILQDIQLCEKYKIGAFKATNIILDHELYIFNKQLEEAKTLIDSKLQTVISQILSFNFCSKKIQQPPAFHSAFRYFDMMRLDNTAFIQKKKNNGNRTGALGNRPLDPINNTVRFNIIKNGDGIPSICVGVAILNIIKKNNFVNCTGNKRGVYCIDQASTTNWGSLQPSNQATSWNHDVPQQSNSTIGFQFNQGDIVELTVDFENNTIIFQVGQQMFDMEIDGTHRDLYPFVCMSNSNSIVQILQ